MWERLNCRFTSKYIALKFFDMSNVELKVFVPPFKFDFV